MREKNTLFKPSTSNNRTWNLLKTFAETSVFWFVFLYFLPLLITEVEFKLSISGFTSKGEIGWIGLILFSLLGIYSGLIMSWKGKGTPLPLDCPNKLVIEGPYKVVRNPMAVAGIGQGVCVGLILGSYLVIIYSITGAILWHIFVRPIEEQDLENRFQKSYLKYKSKVKCWIPRFNIND